MKRKCVDRIEYRNDQFLIHREDGPAIEWSDGEKHYYINGKLHRENGPAIYWEDKYKQYYMKKYYINGFLHNEDGPAVELPDGYQEYWLNGKRYSFEDWDRERKILFLR